MPAITVSTALLAHADHGHAAAQLGGPGLLPLLVAALPFVAGGALLLRSRDAATATVVLFSAAAGFVHAMVTPEHFREDVAVGLFTLAVTVAQMAVVVAGLHRPSRPLWLVAATGNAAVLAVWALSRTTACRSAPSRGPPRGSGSSTWPAAPTRSPLSPAASSSPPQGVGWPRAPHPGGNATAVPSLGSSDRCPPRAWTGHADASDRRGVGARPEPSPPAPRSTRWPASWAIAATRST